MTEQAPEMFSLALSNGNKVTIGFRRVPITEKDIARIRQYLALLEEAIVDDAMAAFSTAYDKKEQEPPPVPVANAARVLRGHFPTDVDLATASERIALRENIRWASTAMEEARLQELHVQKHSGKSSSGSDESSQS